MKLQKPNINLTPPNYHQRYMVMFDLVRFGTTKEVVDHIMYQDEIIKNQSAKRWINVNEKLPEKNTYVLMSATSGHVCTTFYTEPTAMLIDCKISAWFEHANKFRYQVTHWQPLPKAPEKLI